MESNVIYEIELKSGKLVVYEDFCEFTPCKSIITLLFSGKWFSGKRRYRYSDLTGLHFRECGNISEGYLKFEYPGSSSAPGLFAFKSDNAVLFVKSNTAKMKEIYEYIDSKRLGK